MSPNRKGDQSLGYKKAEVIKYHQLHHFYCGETIFKIVSVLFFMLQVVRIVKMLYIDVLDSVN